MKFSIRVKLIAFSFCIVLLVGGSIALYSIFQGRGRIFTSFEEDAREITSVISRTIADDLYLLNLRPLRQRLESARTNPGIMYTYVTDLQGVVLTDGTQENALRDQKLNDSFTKEMLGSGAWISRLEGKALKVGGPILMPDGRRIGYLHVGFSLADPQRIVHEVTRTSLYITVICLGIGAILAVIFATSFSRPILSIVQASREIGEGKLDTRLPIKRSDELGVLAESINRMARALQTRQAETQQAEEKLAARYKELEALHDIGQTILSSPDFKTVLEKILEQTLSIGSLDVGVIRLWDSSGEIFRPVASRGYRNPENVQRHQHRTSDGTTKRFTTRAMTSKKLQIEEDVQGCAGLRTFKSEGVQSAVVIPICVGDQVLGVMQLGSRTPRKFHLDEVRILEAIGNQTGIAVQKARLFQETKRKAEELSIAYKAASTFNQSLDFEATLNVLLDELLNLVSTDAASLRLLNEGGDFMEFVVTRGFPRDYLLERSRIRDIGKAAGHVLATGEVVISSDLSEHPFFRGGILERFGFRSTIYVPIKAKGKVLGVLNLASREKNRFGQREKDIFLSVSYQMGLSLDNARLFRETQRNLERIRALHEIETAISSTLDLHAILDVLLEKTALFFPLAAASTIRLLNKETGSLDPVACLNIDEQEWKAATATVPGGVARMLPKDNAPVAIRDAQTDPGSLVPELLRKYGLVSYLRVPLLAKGDLLGMLTVFTKEEHEFTNEEIEFLRTFAGQTAIAIHNSQLFEEIRFSKRQVEKVNSILAEQAVELTRSNRELQQFAYVASHDLQEPLRMVASYVQLLAKRYKGKLDSDADEFINYAVDGANRMQGLIRALLTYSRVGTRGKDFEPTDCEVVLDGTLADLRAAIEESGAVVAHDPLPTVVADGTQLGQLFQNLIGNAIKFRNQRPPVVHVSAKRDGREWVFCVRDNGIGIEVEHFERIFIIFQRLHGKGEYPGTGIGLAVCKKIVERHGGRIWVESEPGKGATFYFTMPA